VVGCLPRAVAWMFQCILWSQSGTVAIHCHLVRLASNSSELTWQFTERFVDGRVRALFVELNGRKGETGLRVSPCTTPTPITNGGDSLFAGVDMPRALH